MKRRTVQTIKETLSPKEIYELIWSKECEYPISYRNAFATRDRSGMSFAFVSAGRVTEIFGGQRFRRIYVSGLWQLPEGSPERTQGPLDPRNWREEPVGKYTGIKREDIQITEDFIFVDNMCIVKRTPRVIAKYGAQVALRDRLIIPLKRGLYDNVFNDQLVPFGWLIIEHLKGFTPEKGKLFPYQDSRAWEIIRECTGKFPNWFRAQADRFYGSYINRDSNRQSKFVGRVKAESSMPYTRYDPYAGLKDKTLAMDFEWIDKAVQATKERIEKQAAAMELKTTDAQAPGAPCEWQ